MAGSKEVLKKMTVPATVFTIAAIWTIQALSMVPLNRELAKIDSPALELALFIVLLWPLEMGITGLVINKAEKIRAGEENSSVN